MYKGAINSLDANGNTAMYNGLCVAMDRIYKKSQELGGNCTPIIFVLTDGDSNTGYKFSETKDIIAGMNIPIYTISYNYAADSLSELASINEAASIIGNSEDITYKLRNLFKARFYPRSCSKKDSLHAASSGQRETLPANRHKKEHVIKKGVAGHLLRPKTQVAIGSILCTHNSWKTTRQRTA